MDSLFILELIPNPGFIFEKNEWSSDMYSVLFEYSNTENIRVCQSLVLATYGTLSFHFWSLVCLHRQLLIY